MVRRSVFLKSAAAVLGLSLVAVAVPVGAVRESTKQKLERIEGTLAQIIELLTPAPPPPGVNRTRLLFPFASNTAGFDLGVAISNTGRDSSGVVGVAGRCTIHYFGTNAPAPKTTNAAIPPGGQLAFTLSTGGGLGITAAPNFQGYIEADCAFPFAHGYGFLTDGPIGSARVSSVVPALVLPHTRTNTFAESLGQ